MVEVMIAKDKILHFAAGAVIAGVVGYFTTPLAGFVTAAIIGLVKEIYDWRNPDRHTADSLDFIATVFGGGVAALVLIFLGTL